MTRDEIERLRQLMQRHCVRFGDFALASGPKGVAYVGKLEEWRTGAVQPVR
jgi:hypothetical protein